MSSRFFAMCKARMSKLFRSLTSVELSGWCGVLNMIEDVDEYISKTFFS